METIKEEKKADLEQLLNSLIQRGWRPFNKDIKEFFTLNEFTCGYRGEGTNHLGTIRAIVSKESGLWQFCEENKMLIGFSPRTRTKNAHETYGSILGDIEYWGSDYQYRLIESSLKDESELEDFLLSNIKVEGKV